MTLPTLNPARRVRPIADARGFTMIELLVVILIVGILTVIALPAFLGQRTRAEDTEARLTLHTAVVALQTHYTDHISYDATKADLLAIEPALGEASTGFAVTGTDTGFTVAEDSGSGTRFTLVQAGGTVTRSCSDPGRGICRTTADADGNRW